MRVKAREEAETLVAAAAVDLFTAQRDDWRDYHLGDLATEVRYGTSEKAHDEPSGTPILRMGNIRNGRLDLTDLENLQSQVNELTAAQDATQAELEALRPYTAP